jgi:3-hydroxyacyl-CoA dehydrogenase/enoyl-CoA hydratase/3-hydroxybutyryl-CoA epimerase
MNVLTIEAVHELDACVDEVLADPALKGAVITSAKKDFAGGMDLKVLASLRAQGGSDPAGTMFGFVHGLHGVLRKIERGGADPKTGKGGKPFAWACPGTAMGIGLEIGLACHRRFAADTPKAKIGLPEIKVGLFPGAGGTTRLVRMLGIMGAAPFLLEGKTPDPKGAKAAGLIDEVTAPEALHEAAIAWVREAGEGAAVKPWDSRGFKIPGGAPYTPQGFPIFLGGVAMTHGKSQGAYPAPKALLSAIYEGALVDIDTALRIEARWFVKVLLDPTATAMIRTLFLDKQALEKGAKRPGTEPDRKVSRLGVIGAGMMGAGIAHVGLLAGMEVVLIDRDDAATERGEATVAKLLDGSVKARALDAAAREATAACLTPTTDLAALSGCDLVIEAVFEDTKVKTEVLTAAAAHLGPEAIIATNTSTLPVSDLAAAAPDPARFLGIHFFSPVHRMMLVEIIMGRDTGDRALATALDFVRQLRKTPIVVNDARFFYANRCIIPYINEGLRMVAEGVAPALVEHAARMLGFPVGPLQLTDETSLELGLAISRATRAAMGNAYPASPADDLMEKMVEGLDRKGRKNKAGMYAYDEKGKRIGLWPGLADHFPPMDHQPALEDVQNRLMMIQALEAVRALEEGVLTDVREGDVGAILGWGFAPWSGGPFAWLDRLGSRKALALAEQLATDHGERFAPPQTLRDRAAEGGLFHAGPASAAVA